MENKQWKKYSALFLVMLLFIIAVAPTSYAATKNSISLKAALQYAQEREEDLHIPDEFLNDLSDHSKSGKIMRSDFQSLVQKHKVSSEYIQYFINDRIVYNDYGTIRYAPIDPDLKKNTYNWENLVHESDEIRYVRNGKSKAIKGIDVSKYQGNIDWERVKNDGVKYAFIRLGYRGYGTGKLMLDGYYEQNLQNATKAGVDVGVYFYSQAVNTQEAIEEAQVVLSCIKDYDITYPVVFDTEDPGSSSARTAALTADELTDITIAFCETIEKAGYHPMIYTYTKCFLSDLNMKKLEKYDKWLAQYYKTPFFPYDFKIWQYTGKGRVDGIEGNVDLNLSFVDYSSNPIRNLQ